MHPVGPFCNLPPVRQPTLARSRRRTRQQRLARTLFGLLLIVVVLVIVGKLAGGGGKKEEPTQKVSFVSTTTAETDSGLPDATQVKTESAHIVSMLNDWYDRAFVDPKLFGDGSFAEVRAHFGTEARVHFAKDLDSLTIGEAREQVSRVSIDNARVDVTVFFQNGKTPRFAVAAVTFAATAKLKEKKALPLRIQQKATYHLERRPNGDWLVSYYKVHESQDSVRPSPSASTS